MLENMLLLNTVVATGVLILEIIVVIHILIYLALCFGSEVMREKLKIFLINNWNTKMKYLKVETLEKYLILVFFLFSLTSSIMTLVYSEYFGLVPCALCWFQRVFMYGIVILTGTALMSKNEMEQKGILKYVLNFSIFGLLFALYQHAEQILALYGKNLPCPVSGADCSKLTLFEYGHITFPWMAVVLFAFFITLILLRRKLK